LVVGIGRKRPAIIDGHHRSVVPLLPEWKGAPVTKANTDWGELTLVGDTGARDTASKRAGCARQLLSQTGRSPWGSSLFWRHEISSLM